MTIQQSQIDIAKELIRANRTQIAAGAKEDVIRQTLASYLRPMFPDIPPWIEEHIRSGESFVRFGRDGRARTGFVDNLVGLTAIEYESNLEDSAKFQEGYGQVRDYCAALLARGEDQNLIIGVLSDTIHWRAYAVERVDVPTVGPLEGKHVHLQQIEVVDASPGTDVSARQLIEFLQRYLRRLESRPLSADSIRNDLGFESRFCGRHLDSLNQLVREAFRQRPDYGQLITNLWREFVDVTHPRGSAPTLDMTEYADELYLVTLSKLVCANVIERDGLLNDDRALISILDGDYFKSKGLENLVEYDYFGWLNAPPFVANLLPIARAMQEDLRAYNFARIPSEDLFGEIMAQMARRSRRLLLGQEWTPVWLAHRIVEQTIAALPEGELPRFVDMCCGSGAIIVEVVRQAKHLIGRAATDADARIQALSQAVTGFDVDPLAVMLSKINWVLAARDYLEPFGAYPVVIPIYHADSLFATLPLTSTSIRPHSGTFYELEIAGQGLRLPRFLISRDFRETFDDLLNTGYRLAESAQGTPALQIEQDVVAEATHRALARSSMAATEDQVDMARLFLVAVATTIDKLEREGRNGIWSFVLRNSYRPGLVTNQFNGLVSNPPWLALSKPANNPYHDVLRRKAEYFGIRPAGPAFLHVELATIFLLHAIDQYLQPKAVVGCIVPETVLNGYHHNPFRTAAYWSGGHRIPFSLSAVWRVGQETFKNRAIVLFGKKVPPLPGLPNPIPGALVSEAGAVTTAFHRLTRGNRTAWSEQALGAQSAGFFSPANFRQGADIMPRTLFFHEVASTASFRGQQLSQVRPIDRSSSPLAFVVKDAKEYKDFRIVPQTLTDDLIFDVLTSNLLTQFDLATPLKALLPIQKNTSNVWSQLSDAAIAAKGGGADAAIRQIGQALGNGSAATNIWTRLDTRSKLSQQVVVPGKYLVFTGSGGANVCSTFIAVDALNPGKLIIDQTLYWAQVDSEDAAIYLAGLFNSEAINLVIKDFQPKGLFGARHIHSLPFEVTPPYDPTLTAHQEVVASTRALQVEYENAKAINSRLQGLLNPNNGSLASRRKAILGQLRALSSYEQYDVACRALYGVESS